MKLTFLRIPLLLSLLAGCAKRLPFVAYDDCICCVVDANWGWKTVLKKTSNRHSISPGLVMSIIFNESSFKQYARPKEEHLWGWFSYQRSSAYGYAQIKDETWQWYRSHNPGWFQSRTQFSDSADFIGWYYDLFIDRFPDHQNAADFYLAYHEGLGGYKRETYRSKKWLVEKSKHVAERAAQYDQQLLDCLT